MKASSLMMALAGGILILITLIPLANAVENPGPFKIRSIKVAQPQNFHFRVIAEALPDTWLCNNGPKNPAWAFINESDPGSKGMMSALLTAYASKKTVSLVTEGVDIGGSRFCKIVEFEISG